jgi:2-iminobutanoate/2-iminopropanoate deaminase
MEPTYLSPGLPSPPDPYAHGIQWGQLVFIAGQVAFDETNNIVGTGDPAAQARQVWRNLATVAESAGGTVRDIIKITVFLADIRDAHSEIAVRRELFAEGRFPICTQVQVANLGLPGLLMEIDAIAIISAEHK